MATYKKMTTVMLFAILFAMHTPTAAFAEASAPTETDVMGGAEVATAIGKEVEAWRDKYGLIMRDLEKSFIAAIDKVRQTIISNGAAAQDKSATAPMDEFADVIADRVLGRLSTMNVSLKLDEIVLQANFGYNKIENVEAGSEESKSIGNNISSDAYLYEKYKSIFCTPNSANSDDECAKKKITDVAHPNENFIDFLVSERTWTNETVLDVMLLARRFFVGTIDRVALGLPGTLNPGQYIRYQEAATRANLRMSILNDLASRRAPTSSRAADTVLGTMFEIMSPNGESPSVDPEAMCGDKGPLNDKSATPAAKQIAAYVCSFATKAKDGSRLISQAALDRIMQHDYYMSGDFYAKINAPEYGAVSMDKMQVFLKAQQVAQDYRQLRLLQMKTAALALNMMNRR